MASALGASPWPPTHPPHHHRCTQTVDPCRRRAAPVMVGCICAEDEGGPPPVFASSLRPCCCSSSLSPHLAVQQPGQGEGAARPGSISLLHAGELDEQVAREAATASGGAAQERPPPGETPGRERKAAQVPLEARQLGAVAEEELRFHGVERRGAPTSL
ncbi:hypothetical protein VPH35_007730 [Triticum aestivum]